MISRLSGIETPLLHRWKFCRAAGHRHMVESWAAFIALTRPNIFIFAQD
jgi:hypothetical protein